MELDILGDGGGSYVGDMAGMASTPDNGRFRTGKHECPSISRSCNAGPAGSVSLCRYFRCRRVDAPVATREITTAS